MNISVASAAGRRNLHTGGSQDQVVMEIKTKIKEVKQEIQKVNRSLDLTDSQKKAKREMLQTQLDALQQQLTQRQQQLREERQKQAEKTAAQNPGETRSAGENENRPAINEKTADALIATDLDIKHAERLDTVRISLKGQAKVLAAQNESDTVNLGGALESNLENAAKLNDRIRSLDHEIGSRLADINGIDRSEEKTAQKDDEKDVDKKQDGVQDQEEKRVDVWA